MLKQFIRFYGDRYPHDKKFLKLAFNFVSSTSPKMVPRLLFVFCYAALVKALYEWLPHVALLPFIPQMAAGVLFLLLIFRINSSYDRWWEARKLWGVITNLCRSLATIILAYRPPMGSDITNEDLKKWHKQCIDLIKKIPFTIRDYLRARPGEISDQHPALMLSLQLSHQFNAIHRLHNDSPIIWNNMQEHLVKIIDCFGACERILNTPLPQLCDIKIKRFLVLYLLIIPFAFVEVTDWGTPFIVVLISYPILSLEQIAIELENPFSEKRLGHLPLTQYCEGIKKNLDALLTLDHETLENDMTTPYTTIKSSNYDKKI